MRLFKKFFYLSLGLLIVSLVVRFIYSSFISNHVGFLHTPLLGVISIISVGLMAYFLTCVVEEKVETTYKDFYSSLFLITISQFILVYLSFPKGDIGMGGLIYFFQWAVYAFLGLVLIIIFEVAKIRMNFDEPKNLLGFQFSRFTNYALIGLGLIGFFLGVFGFLKPVSFELMIIGAVLFLLGLVRLILELTKLRFLYLYTFLLAISFVLGATIFSDEVASYYKSIGKKEISDQRMSVVRSAIETKNPFLCPRQFSQNNDYDYECILEIAIAKKEVQICDLLEDVGAESLCNRIAGDEIRSPRN